MLRVIRKGPHLTDWTVWSVVVSTSSTDFDIRFSDPIGLSGLRSVNFPFLVSDVFDKQYRSYSARSRVSFFGNVSLG